MFVPAQPESCPTGAHRAGSGASANPLPAAAPRSAIEAGAATRSHASALAFDEAGAASLHALHMLAGATLAAIAAATASARIEQLPRDARIFAQGSLARRACAVVTGSVRIVQTGCDGGQIICCFAARGESFGIAAMFNDARHSGDAIAVQPCTIASWSKAQLLDLIEASPRIAINLIGSVGHCLVESHNRVRELATQRCEQRIAHALLRFAGQAGLAAAGHCAITIPLRRRDVAETAGTTLHTASRALAAWEKCGLLVTREQQLLIHDMPALARIAQGGAA